MKREETIKLLQILKWAYPHYFQNLSKTDFQGMINLWELQFEPYEARIVELALTNYIKTNKYPPTVAGIFEEMNKLETGGDEEQTYWEQLAKLCRRASVVTQAEFEALPEPLKKWLRNLQNLKELGQIGSDIFNSVTRGQFFREIKPIVESEKAKERVQHIALAQQKVNFLGE